VKLTVVHNPESGDRSWSNQRVERLLRDAGHTPRIVSTKANWEDALAGDAEAFVAAGGDGTVHKLLHALESRDAPVAILPTGTANNIAHALGFNDGDDLFGHVTKWVQNERALLLAHVHAHESTHPFVEVFGAGAFAAFLHEESAPDEYSDPAAALVATRRRLAEEFMRADTVHISLSIDGVATEDDYVLLECLNLPYYGPRVHLAPDAAPDAPTLTIAGVRDEQRAAFARWMTGGGGDASPFLIGHGTRIIVAADAPTHIDGHVGTNVRGGKFEIEGGGRRLRVWV
jgi:diacylglycerol kinase (ATP)